MRLKKWQAIALSVVLSVVSSGVLLARAASLAQGPELVKVVQVARPVPVYQALQAADLRVVEVAKNAAVPNLVGSIDQALGKQAARDLYPGELLTKELLTENALAPAEGKVIVGAAVDAASSTSLVRPGDLVNVLGASSQGGAPAVLAVRARVVAVKSQDGRDIVTTVAQTVAGGAGNTAGLSGILNPAGGTLTVGMVALEVTEQEAVAVAGAQKIHLVLVRR